MSNFLQLAAGEVAVKSVTITSTTATFYKDQGLDKFQGVVYGKHTLLHPYQEYLGSSDVPTLCVPQELVRKLQVVVKKEKN